MEVVALALPPVGGVLGRWETEGGDAADASGIATAGASARGGSGFVTGLEGAGLACAAFCVCLCAGLCAALCAVLCAVLCA